MINFPSLVVGVSASPMFDGVVSGLPVKTPHVRVVSRAGAGLFLFRMADPEAWEGTGLRGHVKGAARRCASAFGSP